MNARFALSTFLTAAPIIALVGLASAAPRRAAENAAPAAPPPPAAARDAFASTVLPLTTKYCVPCHGAKDPPAGVDLSKYKSAADLRKDADTWRRVTAQLQAQSMPPIGSPALAPLDRADDLAAIARVLTAGESTAPNPGRVLIHRLNRAEYNNTIRDLTGVDTHPADKFPPDGSGGGGFDNDADTLFLPPMLMERYLQAATDILSAAPVRRLAPIRPSPTLTPRAAAQADIARFTSLAFRQPVEASEVGRLLTLYDAGQHRGLDFDASVRLALKAVLVSPQFLFRIEQDPAGQDGKAHPLSDVELASRLSYFLWSSMPDDTLFRLAAARRLHDPAILEQQVHRMLLDPKAHAFSDNFVGQWLRVRELYSTARPDPGHFPDFTPALRDALYQEPVLLFDSVIHDDSSLLSLLDSDYTYLNESLAKHYGISGVTGPEMRRVTLTDRARGGVLTSGAVLTLTSYPLRTSPVLRGKFVLEQILGEHVPPPPPVVATLSQDDKPTADGLTFRQRLEQHRSKPECAGCHSRMDPLGFGLENFDAIGRWRSDIGGKPIDASGVLATGEKFAGPVALKALLLAQKDEFARNLTEKMLSYALGRGLEPYDSSAVQKITDTLKQKGYRSGDLILGIVESYPFRYRKGSGETTAQTKSAAIASIIQP